MNRLGHPAAGPAGGVSSERFKEALARWASGVAVVAVRDDGRVYATTVTSFLSVSAEPPLVLMTFGPGAQALPFLQAGSRFVVNVLSETQRRLATVFADAFPVGPSPFPTEGDPVLEGSHCSMLCTVSDVGPAGPAAYVVLARVESATTDADSRPLLHYLREYRSLGDEGRA